MGWQSATQIQRISTAKQTSAVPRIRQPTPDHNASSPDRTIPIQNTSLTYQLPVWSGMAWLDLRRLTYFRAIVEAGSISEASRRLNVPQPALSYHLKELEADFGAPLLCRSAKGVTLTEGGQLLVDHATIILAQVRRAEVELCSLRDRGKTDARVIRIAALPSLSNALTPQLLIHFAKTLPDTGHFIIETVTQVARDMLVKGEIDFAIVVADERTPQDQWLAQENLLLCMPANHPDREEIPITLEEALGEALMIPGKGKPVRNLVETLASEIGCQVRVVHEIDGPNLRKQAMIAGLGRTFLPWIAVRDEVKAGLVRYREVKDPPLSRHMGLEWRKDIDPQFAWSMHKILAQIFREILH